VSNIRISLKNNVFSKRILMLGLLYVLLIPLSSAYSSESMNYELIVTTPTTLVMNSSNGTGKDYFADTSFQFQHVGNESDEFQPGMLCHGFYCLVSRPFVPFLGFFVAISLLVGSQAFFLLIMRRRDEEADPFWNTIVKSLFIVVPVTLAVFFIQLMSGIKNSVFVSFYRFLIYLFIIILFYNFLKTLRLFVMNARLKNDEGQW